MIWEEWTWQREYYIFCGDLATIVDGCHSRFDYTHFLSNCDEDGEWTGEADEREISEGLNAVPCDTRCQKWKSRQNHFDYVDEITTIGSQMFEWQADHPCPGLSERKRKRRMRLLCKDVSIKRDGAGMDRGRGYTRDIREMTGSNCASAYLAPAQILLPSLLAAGPVSDSAAFSLTAMNPRQGQRLRRAKLQNAAGRKSEGPC